MAHKLKAGLVHIYTGNGKGKTTAAFGLAVRSAGAGLKVCIYQFIKGLPYSENTVFKKMKNITIEQCGRGCFIKDKPVAQDIRLAERGFKKAVKSIRSGVYDVVILDEINVAMQMGLVKTSDVMNMLKNRPVAVEILLTGRYCPKSIFRYADLVTEMRKIKHPYDLGIQARKGIEF